MSSETAKELEHKDPVQLIRGLMGACQKYFPRHVQFRLTSFFQFLLDYRGMHDLLLLAVCQGVYGVQKKVREEAVPVSPGVTEVNSGRDVQMAEEMNKFLKQRFMHTVWVSYKFREELPQEENETFRILSDNYDRVHQIDLNDSKVLEFLSSLSGKGGNAEKDRYQKRQLQQCLLALLYVMKAARNNRPLTEDFLKTTHDILMHKLLTGDNEEMIAGEYRECMVSTSNHTYPDHKCIKESIARIVRNYEMEVKAVDIDKYHRAVRLLLHELMHNFLTGDNEEISIGSPLPLY